MKISNKTHILRTAAVLCLLAIMFSCGYRQNAATTAERLRADSIAASAHGISALNALHKRLERSGNTLADMATLRRLGTVLRDKSRFDEALHAHEQALRLAQAAGDTIETVRALNDIGTDYRRLGMLDAAQEYHYRALATSRECGDTSALAQKNFVTSLNGLGNVYLTMGNYAQADSALRRALKGEQKLRSDVGMAINYANLGYVFEQRGMADSAWACYRMSLAYNLKAANRPGTALCHTSFGSLYEKEGRLDKAAEEYEQAYNAMAAGTDRWLSLKPLIGMARTSHLLGDEPKALRLLDKARATAEQIKAAETQARIHELYYKVYERQGDYRLALRHHVLAKALDDSVKGQEKLSRIESMRHSIDSDMHQRRIAKAEKEAEKERTAKRISIAVAVVTAMASMLLLALMLYIQKIRARSLEAMRQVGHMRESFFTNITHEFRTPLTLMLGMGHDLQHRSLSATEIHEIGEGIERQGNNLLTLINQLLDISKIKSAVGTPDWCYGNIAAHVEMTVDSYRDFTRSRDINLQFSSPKELFTDFVPDYLSKVLNNLISNAVKFTPRYGTVTITLERHAGHFTISVADTGKGMTPEVQKHVFEPFYQAPNSTYSIGTGVGLALTKQIVDSVKARISVKSRVGEGTTFTITAPITSGKGRPATAAETPAATPILAQKADKVLPDAAIGEGDEGTRRVLVVEDNSDVAAYIGAHLPKGFAAFYAQDGSLALEKARLLVPDVVITDVMMPVMDGLEMCRRMRADELTCHIPIIIVTAKADEPDRIKGIEAGADAYMTKPFSNDELATRIEKLLEQRRRLRDKYSHGGAEPKEPVASEADRQFITRCTTHVHQLLAGGKQADVAAVASLMCMSYSQFYRKLSAVTGCTPTQYIQRIKVKKARRMLDTNPQMSFKDVAEQCGFSDYSNFVRAFKNVCDVTPTQYVRRAE